MTEEKSGFGVDREGSTARTGASVSELQFAQNAKCRWCQVPIGERHRKACPARDIKSAPEQIAPALTAEEWTFTESWSTQALAGEAEVQIVEDGDVYIVTDPTGAFFHGTDRHALAAFCLHQQPFGFTREMADALRELSRLVGDRAELWALADAAADRIEALLPRVAK